MTNSIRPKRLFDTNEPVEVSISRQFVVICGHHGIILVDYAAEPSPLRLRHPNEKARAVWEFDLSDMQCGQGGEACSQHWFLGFSKGER
jgi:hypothetical protein